MIQINKKGVEVTVTPIGDVVAGHVDDLKIEILELVHYEYTSIIVDMKNVQMIDSMGIGMLVAVKNSLVRYGGELTLINTLHEISEIFKIMQLNKHFVIAEKAL